VVGRTVEGREEARKTWRGESELEPSRGEGSFALTCTLFVERVLLVVDEGEREKEVDRFRGGAVSTRGMSWTGQRLLKAIQTV